MKKFFIFIATTIFASLVLVSCIDNTYNIVQNNISELRQSILTYSDETMYVTFMSGVREKNYIADGVSTENIYFAVLNLEFVDKAYEFNEKHVKYRLTIDKEEYSGEMLNNPYDNSFVADLGVNAISITDLEVILEVDDIEQTLQLQSVTEEWEINGSEALKLVCKDLKEYIRQDIIDNQFNGEVYIKVVYNDRYAGEYFWYVQIVTNDNTYTEIVNPITSEIVAKNIK